MRGFAPRNLSELWDIRGRLYGGRSKNQKRGSIEQFFALSSQPDLVKDILGHPRLKLFCKHGAFFPSRHGASIDEAPLVIPIVWVAQIARQAHEAAVVLCRGLAANIPLSSRTKHIICGKNTEDGMAILMWWIRFNPKLKCRCL